MSLRKKLVVVMIMLCLAAVSLMVGVWALKTVNFSVGGDINFTTKGINATISQGVLSGGTFVVPADADTKMRQVEITTTKSQTQIQQEFLTWHGLELSFDRYGNDVQITFSITNNTAVSGEYIWVNVNVNNGAMQNAIANISMTSATIAPSASQEFVITFKVIDKSASASLYGFNINFDMQIAKGGVDASTISDLAFTYNDSNMTASVKGNNASATSITIPEYVINGGKMYVVNRIDNGAFKDYSSLKTLNVPDSIGYVLGDIISGCSILEYTEKDGGKYLGNSENPYSMLCGLTATDITSVTEFTIQDSTKFIYSAFYGCTNLTKVVIPNSLKGIGYCSFRDCTSLEKVDIPLGVQSLGDGAFLGCTSLKTIDIPYTVDLLGTTVFQSCTSLKEAFIPDSVTNYGPGVFNKCYALERVWLPLGLKVIPEGILQDCSSLEDVVIPNGVTSIEPYAFNYCTNLKDVRIPDSVTTIDNFAFQNTASLKHVSIPEKVTTLGRRVFRKSALTTIVIPKSVTTIGEYTCFENLNLKHASFLASVSEIPGYTFYGSTALETVIIPNNIKSIAGTAFYNCTALSDVYFIGTEEEWNAITIGGNNEPLANATVHFVEDESLSVLDFSFDGGSMTACVTGNSISASTDLVVPELIAFEGRIYTVTSVGTLAFKNCTYLTGITLPGTITAFESYAFDGCTNLTKLNFLGDINDWASIDMVNYTSNPTYYTRGLKINGVEVSGTVTIDQATQIKPYAFLRCSRISSVVAGDQVTTIGRDAFHGSGIQTINLPASITSIGSSAFIYCVSLKTVVIEATTPPPLDNDIFANGNANLIIYVPSASVDAYKTATNWSNYADKIQAMPLDKSEYDIVANCVGTINGTTFELAEQYMYNGRVITQTSFDPGYDDMGEGNYVSRFTGYTKVILPKTINSIGLWAFEQSGVSDVYIYSETPPALDSDFVYIFGGISTVYVPSSVLSQYETAEGWTDAYGWGVIQAIPLDKSEYDIVANCVGTINGTTFELAEQYMYNGRVITQTSFDPGYDDMGEGNYVSRFTGYTKVILPKTINSIGLWAFEQSGVSDVYIYSETPPALDSDFTYIFGGISTVYVPSSVLSQYETAEGWTDAYGWGVIQAIPES